VDSHQIIEELERLQTEFGGGKCQFPDPLQGTWRNDIDRIEFDPGTQTYLFVSDS
jgi:hypothetical protein